MARIRINGATWDTGGCGRRPVTAMVVAGRAMMVAVAVTGLGVGLASLGSPVEAARGGPPVTTKLKDESRLGLPAPRVRAPVTIEPFAALPLGTPSAFAAHDAGAASRGAGHFAPPIPTGWQEADFSGVTVADGRTLVAGALRIRLEGLELPGADETCRTVDGRREPCTARAATVLELTTRWRAVSCRYRLETLEEGVGACRVGTSDLAERMARTGLVRRDGQAPRALASAAD